MVPRELTEAERTEIQNAANEILSTEIFDSWAIADAVSEQFIEVLELTPTPNGEPHRVEVMPMGLLLHYGAVMYALGTKAETRLCE